MESVINPEENPELNLKREYKNRILLQLDNELLEELDVYYEERKERFNSRSHLIRCAITRLINPGDKEKQAYNDGFQDCINKIKNILDRGLNNGNTN